MTCSNNTKIIIWKILKYYNIIAKYHVHVTPLFVYNKSRKFFGNAQVAFISLRLKQQAQASEIAKFF